MSGEISENQPACRWMLGGGSAVHLAKGNSSREEAGGLHLRGERTKAGLARALSRTCPLPHPLPSLLYSSRWPGPCAQSLLGLPQGCLGGHRRQSGWSPRRHFFLGCTSTPRSRWEGDPNVYALFCALFAWACMPESQICSRPLGDPGPGLFPEDVLPIFNCTEPTLPDLSLPSWDQDPCAF